VGELDPQFKEVAKEIFEYNYYYIEDQYQLLQQYGIVISEPSLIVVSGNEVRTVRQTHNMPKQSLIDILKTERFSLISEITTETMRLIFNDASHDGIFLIFLSDKPDSSIVSTFTSFARTHKSPKYLFFVVSRGSRFGSQFISNLQIRDNPSVRVEIISAKDREQRFAYTGAMTEKGLGDFLRSYDNNAVRPLANSEPVRNSSTMNTNCITDVYRSTFKEFVIDNSDDVVVLFCVSTCSACGSISTLFRYVSLVLCANKNLKFAYMNPMANDIDEYDVKEYPSIVLFPAMNKSNPAVFRGFRTETKITNFIRKNSYHRHMMPELSAKIEIDP